MRTERRRPLLLLCLVCLFLPLLSSAPALALGSDWQRDEAVAVRLISGIDGVGQETVVPLGLDVQLEHGWHTYWRSPGIAGLPPSIDWKGSLTDAGNLKEATLLYPAPKRYTDYGLETIGYRDHVVFPIDAAVRTPGRSLVLHGALSLLVCSAICVPKNVDLALTVPEGPATESAESSLLRAARDRLPGGAATSGFVLKSIANDGQSLAVTIESRNALQEPDLFIENDMNISFAAPSVRLSRGGQTVVFRTQPTDTLPAGAALAGLHATLTVVDGARALEQSIAVPEAVAATGVSAPGPSLSFGLALMLALLGGFILNLMPCVLPVLSLKIFSAIGHGGGETALVRRSFLVTAAGILFSFFLLAGMTIGLKALGLSFGWGVQFQQPVFLTGLIVVLVLFAASLWDLLTITLPGWLSDRLGNAAWHPKLAGDFATGAFATLLATPCTAPFLGTAIGFALASGPRDIVIIFAGLGLGMTIPYLLVAAFPRLATALPKPGPWMTYLRRALGVALLLTALWLVGILAAQITARLALLVALCMAGILLLLALRHAQVSRRLVLAGIALFLAMALGETLIGSALPKDMADVERRWLPFSEHALAANIQEGKTVFVDVTADWCLTCKANQKFVLSRPEIEERLFHGRVIAMQANWTNPNPVIAAFLQKYGRFGIPFNAVFGPGAPDGIVLPELLSRDSILDAIDKAAAAH